MNTLPQNPNSDNSLTGKLILIQPRPDAQLPPGIEHHDALWTAGFDGAWGLPDSLRQKLIKLDLGAAALVLDACFTTGLHPGDQFTVDALLDHLTRRGITPSPGLVRRALGSGLFPTTTIHKPQRGRPQLLYTLPPRAALAQQFAVTDFPDSAIIDQDDLTSLKTYRRAIYRNFVRQHGRSDWSRGYLEAVTGVSQRTLRNYEQQIPDFEVTPNYRPKEISYFVNCPDLAWHVHHQHSRRFSFEIDKYHDGRVVFRVPAKAPIAIMWWKRGAKVTIIEQLVNTYYVPPLPSRSAYKEIPF